MFFFNSIFLFYLFYIILLRLFYFVLYYTASLVMTENKFKKLFGLYLLCLITFLIFL